MHHGIENVAYVPFSFTDKTYLLVLDDILLEECRDGVTGRGVTPSPQIMVNRSVNFCVNYALRSVDRNVLFLFVLLGVSSKKKNLRSHRLPTGNFKKFCT